jgi:hypothetical protein
MGKPVNTHAENRLTLRVPEHVLPAESEERLRLATALPGFDPSAEPDLGWPADDALPDETETDDVRPSERPTSHPSHRPTRRVPQGLAPPSTTTPGESESRGSYSQIVARRR